MLATVLLLGKGAGHRWRSAAAAGHERIGLLLAVCGLLLFAVASGCGTTKSYLATEQLLLSDAVDAAVSQIDFSALAHRHVFLDTTYLKTVKGPALIDSDYVISSLRQQMVSAGVLLVDGRDEADLIAEARMGALGFDSNNVVYGIPAGNNLTTATSALAGTSLLPAIPEISFARREGRLGASKVAVFAYDRETKEPYWQSGISQSASDAKDFWVLGIGPFQSGTIHDGTRFAGANVIETPEEPNANIRQSNAFADYHRQRRLGKKRREAGNPVVTAGDNGNAEGPNLSVTPASTVGAGGN
jgi:hypothetical protein